MGRPDRSISRSVSSELTRDEQQIGEIRNLVEKQQEYILNLLTHHKSEVDSKLQNKQRLLGADSWRSSIKSTVNSRSGH